MNNNLESVVIGTPVHNVKKKPYTIYTREQLLDLGKSVGRITMAEWMKRRDLPGLSPIQREFGDWTSFSRAVEEELIKYEGYIPKPIPKNKSKPVTAHKPESNKIQKCRLKSRHLSPLLKFNLEKKVLELASSGEYDDDPFAVYHITEAARNELNTDSITTTRVYGYIPENIRRQLHIGNFLGSNTSLENFNKIKEFLSMQDPENLSVRYGNPLGLYFLAKDMDNQGIITTMPLEALYGIISSKEKLRALIGSKKVSNTRRWEPKYIELTIKDAMAIEQFLKGKYNMSPDAFFSRYGTGNGALNLAEDLREKGLDLNAKKIYTIMSDAECISKLLESDDKRFELEWDPKVISFNKKDSDFVIGYLKKRYSQNPDKFFEIYGSEIGTVVLSKELSKQGIKINPTLLSQLISNGRSLEELLGIEDHRFRREWKQRTILLTMDTIDNMLDCIRELYYKDSDAFFKQYSNDLGGLLLLKEFNRKGIGLLSTRAVHIFNKGNLLSMLLGIHDERFKKWKYKHLNCELDLVDASSGFLANSYRKDPDTFFSDYGSSEGIYNLAYDLFYSKAYPYNIDLQELSGLYLKPANVMAITGLQDERFGKAWKPRSLQIDLERLFAILNFLEEQYNKDSCKFFDKYGSPAGTYRLAKDLKEEGINVHLNRLGTIVNKGPVLSRMLEVYDERFSTEWKPRSFICKLSDVDNVLNFLRDKYEEDSSMFFGRYGAKDGYVALGRDIEKHFKRPISYLYPIIGDSMVLSDLLNIRDERFEGLWQPAAVTGSRYDNIELIIEFLKNRYEQDPDNFFKEYSRTSGVIDIARDIYQIKKLDMQLTSLSSIVTDGKKLAYFMGVNDRRFDNWNLKYICDVRFSEIDSLIEFMKNKYSEDPDEFICRFGSPGGVIKFFTETEEGTNTRPDSISLILDPVILKEQLWIRDLDADFKPAHITNANSADTKRILNHLKHQYLQNSDRFFEIYGSRMGKIILAKELFPEKTQSLKTNSGQLDYFTVNGERLKDILGVDDNRFMTKWFHKISLNKYELVTKGMQYMASGKKLPQIDCQIDDKLIEYLKFRYEVVRAALQSPSSKYDVTMALSKEAILYIAELFSPADKDKVMDFIDLSIESDKILFEELAAIPVPALYDAEAASDKQITARKLRHEEDMSWEEIASALDISVSTARQYASLGRKGSGKEHNSSAGLDEFTLKAGKLLYSFNEEMRLEGHSLLLQLGSQHRLYISQINKGGEMADIASQLFTAAVAHYDPYFMLRRGENTLLPLKSWVSGYLKWTKFIVNKRQMDNISIDSGGYESDNLYGGFSPIQELS